MWTGTVTVIVENTVYKRKKTLAEEGISILIEERSPSPKNILFDVGRRFSTLLHNLNALKSSANMIHEVVLSHGHAGHVGAFAEAVVHLNAARTIVHPGIFARKAKKQSDVLKESTMFLDSDHISHYTNLVITCEPYQLSDNIWTTGEIPVIDETELGTVERDRHWLADGELAVRDDFVEENAIVIRTQAGLFIVTGCGHRGLPNTIRRAQALFPDEQVSGVMGGFHLMQRPETLPLVISYLKSLNVRYIMPCHCSGFEGRQRICDALVNEFVLVSTGTRIEFGPEIEVVP